MARFYLTRTASSRLATAVALLALVPVPALAQEAAGAQEAGSAPAASQPASEGPRSAPDRFFIAAFDVTGVTHVKPVEIEKAVYQFTGPDRSGQDVESARKAIQAAYVAQGYEAVVVEIPPQDTALFRQGVIQMRVNEAPVGRVQVVDARHHSANGVMRNMPSLLAGEPLNLKTLQADMASANRFPDRTVTPAFRAGKEPGTIDVDLKVQDKLPLHASADLNNDNSPSTTDLRAGGSVRFTNMWGRGHSISASFVVAPRAPSESTVFSGSYLAPFIGTPWSVLLYGYRSNSNVAALGGTNVLGNGYQVGLRGIYRLPAKSTSQSVSFGFDFKDFKQNIMVGGINAGSTPITYLPLVGEYTIAGGGDQVQFDATLGVTAGLRIIKKSRQSCTTVASGTTCDTVDQFQDKAVDGSENFIHVNLAGNVQFATKSDIVVKLGLSGQLADGHQVANEQYGLGGLSSVRGYYQSEAVADSGLGGQLELQSPSLSPHLPKFVDELRFYAFVDGGYTWLLGTIPSEQDHAFPLLGVGGGMRFKLFEHLTGDVLGGVPLISGPVSRKGDPRITFQIRSEF